MFLMDVEPKRLLAVDVLGVSIIIIKLLDRIQGSQGSRKVYGEKWSGNLVPQDMQNENENTKSTSSVGVKLLHIKESQMLYNAIYTKYGQQKWPIHGLGSGYCTRGPHECNNHGQGHF